VVLGLSFPLVIVWSIKYTCEIVFCEKMAGVLFGNIFFICLPMFFRWQEPEGTYFQFCFGCHGNQFSIDWYCCSSFDREPQRQYSCWNLTNLTRRLRGRCILKKLLTIIFWLPCFWLPWQPNFSMESIFSDIGGDFKCWFVREFGGDVPLYTLW